MRRLSRSLPLRFYSRWTTAEFVRRCRRAKQPHTARSRRGTRRPRGAARGCASTVCSGNCRCQHPFRRDQPIAGMAITLPPATTSVHNALVTFSASTTYPETAAECNFSIYNSSTKISATGTTYFSGDLENHHLVPMTLVERIALATTTQKIAVEWNNGGTGICALLNFYGLSAILTT